MNRKPQSSASGTLKLKRHHALQYVVRSYECSFLHSKACYRAARSPSDSIPNLRIYQQNKSGRGRISNLYA